MDDPNYTRNAGWNNAQAKHLGKLLHPKEYTAWQCMKSRCFYEGNNKFEHYGGRGITVCPEWLEFERFYADMGDRPEGNYSLERKDNDRDYSPENCVWASQTQQVRNRSITLRYTIGGVTLALAEWCEKAELTYNCVYKRLKRGLDIEEALNWRSE